MALQNSGAIKLSEIQTEFGGSNPIPLSEYYGAAAGIPSSGAIKMSDFYGKSNFVEYGEEIFLQPKEEHIFTVPSGLGIYEIHVACMGGGGAGGHCYWGGGGGAGGALTYRYRIPAKAGDQFIAFVGIGGRIKGQWSDGTEGKDSWFKKGDTLLCWAGGGGGGKGANNSNSSSKTSQDGGFSGEPWDQADDVDIFTRRGTMGGAGYNNVAGGGGAGPSWNPKAWFGSGWGGMEHPERDGPGNDGQGGQGGGGGPNTMNYPSGRYGGSGGGTGLYYTEENGAGGTRNTHGKGGSGGTNGTNNRGGLYGAGGGGSTDNDYSICEGTNGAQGFVRVIWGTNASFYP